LDPSRFNEKSKAGLLLGETSDRKQNKLRDKDLIDVRYVYQAGDTSCPENVKIYALLRGLMVQMKEAGYVAETKYCLHDVDEEDKEDALIGHNERLALAYSLLNSAARNPIRIIRSNIFDIF